MTDGEHRDAHPSEDEAVTIRPQDISEILRVFAESDLQDLHLEVGQTKIHVSKQSGAMAAAPPAPSEVVPLPPSPAAPASMSGSQAGASAGQPIRPAGTASSGPAERGSTTSDAPRATPAETAVTADMGSSDDLFELTSPLLGVFYLRPSPDQPPFIEVGSEVSTDDDVCVIDVMKMFTRIQAGIDGFVEEILVEDGQLVEHGQLLMRIRPR